MAAKPRKDPGDDPLRLRQLLERSVEHAREHGLRTVVVGLVGESGDLMIPELFDYLESELRVEDGIVRLTRERAVLFLTDIDREGGVQVVERLIHAFVHHFPLSKAPHVTCQTFEVGPEASGVRLRDVLPTLFPSGPGLH